MTLDVTSRPLDPAFVDYEARRTIRLGLDANLVVEAAAGTGKTTELVARILNVLASGRGTLGRMVCVTFTEKAAGEMKLRLREELEKARQGEANEAYPDVRKRLDFALTELEAARIGTIHAFCADILHERPVEAEVDPVFEMAADEGSGTVYEVAFNGWFQDVLQDPPEGVRRLLRRRKGVNQRSREVLRKAGWDVVENRDFGRSWRRPIDFDRPSVMDDVLERLETLGKLADEAYDRNDYLVGNLREIQRVVAEIRAREHVCGELDYDGVEGQLAALRKHWTWRYSGFSKFFGPDILRDTVKAQRAEVKESLDEFCELADSDLAARLREDLRPLVLRYEDMKQRAGQLDFRDLLLKARDLVRGEERVRRELQARFTQIFVDEFQDTDPLQAEILLLLAADDPTCTDWTRARPKAGRLFIVGDPKQSIYRFRRADVALYEVIKQRLLGVGAQLVHLRTSFRAVPGIQQAVNAAFKECMLGGGSQAEYVALAPFRREVPDQPSVVALPVPRPYSDRGKVTGWAIEESLPSAVGAYIEWLVKESGWTVEEGGQRVPLKERHICLLFKRFRSWRGGKPMDITRDYVRSLEGRGVSHVLVGGQSFFARDEVMALKSALMAIEWPEDELSVFATLRGPLFAVGDDALLAYRQAFKRLDYLRVRHDELTPLQERVSEALNVLRDLHRRRNRRPLADTIAELLERTRAHAGFATWATGEQALANVLRLMDMARRFERAGATSFRAFVESLTERAERGDAGNAPIVEEDTDGVRVMTVHKAKGLEFPVVILCDPTAPRTWGKPSRHVDATLDLWAAPLAGCAPLDLLENASESLRRDDEEGVRLAYVAATRARDLLVVPVVGDEETQGWLDVMNCVLYPETRTKRLPAVPSGCPPFGRDSVTHRPARAHANPDTSVAPGQQKPKAGSHSVVWWDPRLLDQQAPAGRGLRDTWVLAPADDTEAEEAGQARYEAWQTSHHAAVAAGARPSVAVEIVTRAAEAAAGTPTRDVAVERVDSDRKGRPHGKRFGELVHRVLEAAPLDPDTAPLASIAKAHARLLDAPMAEAEAAAVVAGAALRHPVLRRAAAAATVHRELELSVPRVVAGSGDEPGDAVPGVLEGVIDLCFREETPEGPRWTVVDFKTDFQLGERAAIYKTQVTLYAELLTQVTGEPADPMLLLV